MYCSSCGTKNEDDTRFCQSCGKAMAGREPDAASPGPASREPGNVAPHVPHYLVQAILVTIFCCLPLGIVSIVYAAQVNGKLAAGDLEGARHASARAKMWVWISFGVGLAIAFVFVLMQFFFVQGLRDFS